MRLDFSKNTPALSKLLDRNKFIKFIKFIFPNSHFVINYQKILKLPFMMMLTEKALNQN